MYTNIRTNLYIGMCIHTNLVATSRILFKNPLTQLAISSTYGCSYMHTSTQPHKPRDYTATTNSQYLHDYQEALTLSAMLANKFVVFIKHIQVSEHRKATLQISMTSSSSRAILVFVTTLLEMLLKHIFIMYYCLRGVIIILCFWLLGELTIFCRM